MDSIARSSLKIHNPSKPTTIFPPASRSRVSSLNLRRSRSPSPAASLQRSDHDVVVVGAGIIGLTIARQILLSSELSVAVVDAVIPCSGATGAGQGYIWMGHKTPGSDTWELAKRSKNLWEGLAMSLDQQGMDPLDALGWKKTGSLLIGRTSNELAALEERVKLLSQAGLRAEYLSAASLIPKEPALEVGKKDGAAFFPDDCQLDASRAVAFIEKGNKRFASQGRYVDFYNNPVISLLRCESNGVVEAVQTSHNIMYGRKAVVIAAGAWSGILMRSLVAQDEVPDLPVRPRKGHLLVLENFKNIQLNHGLMEVGYVDHQIAASPFMSSASGATENEENLSISMTATMDTMGNLVLGSSRQFSGFSKEIDEGIIKRILNRAGEFFPALRALSRDIDQNRTIRIGHRPYVPDGKPVIGHVPGLPKVLLATGHEGNGLSMALGTAEMVADMILDNSPKLDYTPFSIEGRFCSGVNKKSRVSSGTSLKFKGSQALVGLLLASLELDLVARCNRWVYSNLETLSTLGRIRMNSEMGAQNDEVDGVYYASFWGVCFLWKYGLFMYNN